ncbi:hypothetical protein, partial [Mesorhizobium sp. B2-7-1]|uniref:hypothetical protein n=1 Tax=Mesorhizobium sp. B2-7-1 TaxID=2589909 RepID=UPI001AED12CF
MTFQALFRIHPTQGLDSVSGMHPRSNGPGRGSFGPTIEENPAMPHLTVLMLHSGKREGSYARDTAR